MKIEAFFLEKRDWVPNNPNLPVIIYREAVETGSQEVVACAFERLFADHDWPAQWRDGVYDFHHYHSIAHEILGVASGWAKLTVGGPGGPDMDCRAGDAVVLPAGTGHRAKVASDDFMVVGAYPVGQTWDICRKAADRDGLDRIANVPWPGKDPVTGKNCSSPHMRPITP